MSIRDFIGYIMGLILFVVLIPIIMWKLSGDIHPGMAQTAILAVLTLGGIGLSIWSIVYMRLVGRGNPMDAFNHEVAPRTSRLMTRGPYRLCRNPMLLGVFIYYIGLLIYLCADLSLVLASGGCVRPVCDHHDGPGWPGGKAAGGGLRRRI